MSLLDRFHNWITRGDWPPQEALPEPPVGETEQRYTAEEMQAYANAVYVERIRRAQPDAPSPARKFRPLLMDFAESECHGLVYVNGVRRRVPVRCPWQESSYEEQAADG